MTKRYILSIGARVESTIAGFPEFQSDKIRIIAVMKNAVAMPAEPILFDGITKKTLRELKRLPKTCNGDFVEVMACEGGCLAGPCVISPPKISGKRLNALLEAS